MDDRRFDQLAMAISGAAGSRRDSLAIVLGSAAAAVFGLFGIEGTEAKHRKGHGKNKNRRNKDKKKVKFCHCPDNNEKNCKTKTVTKKKAKKLEKRDPNSHRGRCKDTCLSDNTDCNTNRPGECCSLLCCLDNTSSTGGICPTSGGNCCGRPDRGGYCPEDAPNCCGTKACCPLDYKCCATSLNPSGNCCPPDYDCDDANGTCKPAREIPGREAFVDRTVPRIRIGNE